MPRTARIILPDYPHHVTQRGNRKMDVFFNENDYRVYRDILAEQAARYKVGLWAYCLMRNHVHFIAVPADLSGMSLMFREAHRRYTSYINKREGWTGHLWQDRFASFAMSESHALSAARYIENNPVHAGIVEKAQDYQWSSAALHCKVTHSDPLIIGENPLTQMIPDWDTYLQDDKKIPLRAARDREILESFQKSGKPWLGTE